MGLARIIGPGHAKQGDQHHFLRFVVHGGGPRLKKRGFMFPVVSALALVHFRKLPRSLKNLETADIQIFNGQLDPLPRP